MKGNRASLVVDRIPTQAFIKVIRKHDIVKARPLSADEKKRSKIVTNTDILVTDMLGRRAIVSRQEIVSKYTYLSGKRIKLYNWKSDREYTIVKEDNTTAYAVLVKANSKINFTKDKKDYYIICLVSSDGNIDFNTASKLDTLLFKKMFMIPLNDIIVKYSKSSRVGDVSSRLAITQETANNIENVPKVIGNKTEVNRSIPVESGNIIDTRPKVNANLKPIMDKDKVANTVKYEYQAIARIMNDNKIIGFVLQDKVGATRNVSKNNMVALCSKRLVSNIVVAKKENGEGYFLRGNGLKIDMLQPIYSDQKSID